MILNDAWEGKIVSKNIKPMEKNMKKNRNWAALLKSTSTSGDRVILRRLIESRKILISMDNTWSTLRVVVYITLCAEMWDNLKACVWFLSACQFVIIPIHCYKPSKVGWPTHWYDDNLQRGTNRTLCGWQENMQRRIFVRISAAMRTIIGPGHQQESAAGWPKK